ncbi:MAG: fused response regulator/phosphatase, partial [Betaproteobacteria bacterium]
MDALSAGPATTLASTAAVLVVDDVEDNREVLAARLTALGIADITMAADGNEALALIGARSFDLVLLDLMMPNVSGIQVLEALRDQGRLESLPVIMVSASSEMAGVVRCVELGAEDYLTKPINATLLRARIRATLEKKWLRDAMRARLAQNDHDLLAARELQLGMVPGDFIAPDGTLSIHLLLEPSRHIGGDLCDYFVGRGGVLWFAIGDVSGKGAAAAIFMARSWACLHGVAIRDGASDRTPGEILTAINRELCEANSGSMFTTLFLGRLDRASGHVAYANAGHLPPFHLDRHGGCHEIDAPQRLPVGAWP